MSNGPAPNIRFLIPCCGVRCDITVLPHRYTVEDPFFALRPSAGQTYPFKAAELWLFCQLSDATGVHQIEVELSWDVDAEFRLLHTFQVDMGTDRLAVRNYAIRLKKVPFRRAGIHVFRLREGTAILAEAEVRLES